MKPYRARLNYDDAFQVSIDGSRYDVLYVEKEENYVTVGGTGSPPSRDGDWLWVPGENGWDPIELEEPVEFDFYVGENQVAEWDITWYIR